MVDNIFNWLKLTFLLLIAIIVSGCTSVPEGIAPVKNFELPRYLGTWYEIARLDHPFERGLSRVTAEYSLQDGGGVTVVNRGFNSESGEWEVAEGEAYFVDSEDIGHLKVSFFGPFYASYVIFELDKESYQYAMVTGPDRDYFWILSRQSSVPTPLLNELTAKAELLGFATDELIYVEHPTEL